MCSDDKSTVPANSSPPVAVVDIGTSAIRLVVAQVHEAGQITTLDTASRGVLLGHDAFTLGRLSPETIQAACDALRGFKKIMESYGVVDYRAVATSAVRESANSDLFVDRALLRTGIDVEIIEGAEENRLVYAAVREELKGLESFEAQAALLVEVGGGSTDIAFLDKGQPQQSGTYAIGALRLGQTGAGGQASPAAGLPMLRRKIQTVVFNVARDMPLEQANILIALGGDVRLVVKNAGARLVHRTARVVSLSQFSDFIVQTAQLTINQMAQRYQLDHASAETLVPALVVYQELLKRTNVQELIVPQASIRDGMLLDFAHQRTTARTLPFHQQIRSSAISLGRKYQFDENHGVHVAKMAVELFQALLQEHGLSRPADIILEVAALLHDIGLFVGSSKHHKHTQYLLENSDLFGLSRRDMLRVANVARYHRRSTPQQRHSLYASLDRENRLLVNKLGMLLRIANALDTDHLQKIMAFKLIEEDRYWVIEAEADSDLTPERRSIARANDLFAEVFGKGIMLRQVSHS